MRAEHRIHAHLNTKRRFTSSCMDLCHNGMWLQNEHTALNLKQSPSLPPAHSVLPLTCLLSSSQPTPEQEHSWTRNNVWVWGSTWPNRVYLWLWPPNTIVQARVPYSVKERRTYKVLDYTLWCIYVKLGVNQPKTHLINHLKNDFF